MIGWERLHVSARDLPIIHVETVVAKAVGNLLRSGRRTLKSTLFSRPPIGASARHRRDLRVVKTTRSVAVHLPQCTRPI